MEINWIVIAAVLAFAILLVIFVVIKNNKDKKNLTKYLNDNEFLDKNEEPEINDEIK